MTIGRLDFNSEGLLLLTNDGDVARRLEHPNTAWRRRYRVRVHGRVDEDRLADLARGIVVDSVKYGPIEAVLEREQRSNAWLVMSLSEGKNREVRRICEHLGLQVTRLIRVSYGPFQLGNMPGGACEAVPAKALAEQLGGGGERRRLVRIIAGKWRGKKLVVPDGLDVRPTSDRARGALQCSPSRKPMARGFQLRGARVLDGFAGTARSDLKPYRAGPRMSLFGECLGEPWRDQSECICM